MNKALAIVGIGLFAIVVGATASKETVRLQRQSTSDLPQIKNKTQSFRYVSIEKSDSLFNLKMRNESKKVVTGYVLAFGRISEIETDLIIGNKGIAPNAEEVISFPASYLEASAASGEPNTVTVALVVFDDRSSEGDFKTDRKVRDRRLGIKMQLNVINMMLNDAGASGKVSLSDLRNLLLRVSSLPDDQSEGIGSGQHFAREIVMILIKDLEIWEVMGRKGALRAELSGTVDIKNGLNKIVLFNKTLIDRY